ATITRESTADLGLVIGSEAIALIKAPSVMIALPGDGLRLSARNQLAGSVADIRPGAVNSEISVDIANGTSLAAIIPQESVQALGLTPGMPVVAVFDASTVILGVVA